MKTAKEIPTIFVVLGATGDLAGRKIFPSLYSLYKKEKLPKLLNIIAFSRRDWSNDRFRKYARKALKKNKKLKLKKATLDSFLDIVTYAKGNFNNLIDFRKLAERLGQIDGEWKVCSNKLYYLAVPPKYYKKIFINLEKSGLTEPCSPEEGWTRVIVEKPFGRDLETAKSLDALLGKLFREEQIYRIDHYLGKEVLQNILAFRFSNNIFEQSWSNRYVDNIEVKLLETEGIEGRGAFYDGVGALRDVGQNHLLQMLALVTMNNPGVLDSDKIRNERERLLGKLKIPARDDVKNFTFRAQYSGYKRVEGVEKNSDTETYFKLRGYINDPRWEGVPFTIEGGKSLKENKKEVVIRFKHPSPCFCPPGSLHDYHNKVIFALEPREEITFRIQSKKPGYKLEVERRSFNLPYHKKSVKGQHTEEYERLLLDCFLGDQTLYVSTKEMEAMWKFSDPVIKEWRDIVVPLEEYEAGSDLIRDKAKRKLGKSFDSRPEKEIGIVGLGKMGSNLTRHLMEKGWKVVGFNRSEGVTKNLKNEGVDPAYTLEALIQKLKKPRLIWLMIPVGDPVRITIEKLSESLERGDMVIDGGNSFYKNSIENGKILTKKGIDFVDVGVSGGPEGARNGACLMIGGNRKLYEYLIPLYVDLSVDRGYEFFDGIGAGHFVKMVHNGIEYGMMQAIAEGMDIMKNSDYKFHLKDVANIYNHGSVIEGKLIKWMKEAYDLFGDNLDSVSGSAGGGGSSGGQLGKNKSEAVWTIEVAKKLRVPVNVIEDAVKAREKSQKKPSYQGKVINALRNRFGGHDIKAD